MRLSTDQRRALELLAESPRGCTESIMRAHGFSFELLQGLMDDGLAELDHDADRPRRLWLVGVSPAD
jgi:hypothetical protein